MSLVLYCSSKENTVNCFKVSKTKRKQATFMPRKRLSNGLNLGFLDRKKRSEVLEVFFLQYIIQILSQGAKTGQT